MQENMAQLSSFRQALSQSKYPLAIAGAGLSAASGIPTFRGAGGLWRTHDALSLATPEAFRKDPSLVWQFYNMRREVCLKAKPNPAHRTIATLMNDRKTREKVFPNQIDKESFSLITQNVDGLSVRAFEDARFKSTGSASTHEESLIEMHGSLFKTICTSCRSTRPNFDSPICPSLQGTEDQTKTYSPTRVEDLPRCKEAGCGGLLRPGVVWFGESIPLLPKISDLISNCDLILVLGTSSTVYPAASFASEVKSNGGEVAVFNLERSGSSDEEVAGREIVDWVFQGGVEETLGWALDVQ